MKNRLFKLFATITLALTIFVSASCGGEKEPEHIDYVAQLKLDLNSTTTSKEEVRVYNHVDGDTTHFYSNNKLAKDGILKARYNAIDTPESTIKVEEWGKAAANFTKSKLESADSIVIESVNEDFEYDSTGERVICWVWYRPQGTADYRLLNLEIVQEGYSMVKNAGSTEYGKVIAEAYQQAIREKIRLNGTEKDPDYYYGDAQNITMRELRTNLDTYKGIKVSVEGLVTRVSGSTAYAEDYDEETSEVFGIQIYMGFESFEMIKPGNVVRFIGTVQLYETANTWQIAGLTYMAMKPDYKDNLKLISENNPVEATKITYADIQSRKDNLLANNVAVENLKVTEIYTTKQGDSAGAMTLTCEDAQGNEITIRTIVLKDEEGNLITDTYFKGKNITITSGIFDKFDGEYQIRVFGLANIIINN